MNQENEERYYDLEDYRETLDELEIYRLRLAGALMASEGANPLVFQEQGVLPQVRDCVTIKSVLDLYAEMQKYRTECDMLAQENAQLRKALENKQ
jgi:hypothetical protein